MNIRHNNMNKKANIMATMTADMINNDSSSRTDSAAIKMVNMWVGLEWNYETKKKSRLHFAHNSCVCVCVYIKMDEQSISLNHNIFFFSLSLSL